MKAAIVKRFGDLRSDEDASEVLEVVGAHPKPSIVDVDNELLVAVHAVSLSPGDYRMLCGDTDAVKRPPAWPYIPLGDLSGIVVEVGGEAAKQFSVGDCVLSGWDGMCGVGALAELAVVRKEVTRRWPTSVSSHVEAAALANSCVNAVRAVRLADIKENDRVLVLGGSGGMGTIIVQLLRSYRKCRHLAATSSDLSLLRRLDVDDAIDYRRRDWWTGVDEPYDVIIDCAIGVEAYSRCTSALLRSSSQGGRFIAVVLNEPRIIMHHYYQMITFMAPPLFRTLLSRLLPFYAPRYQFLLGGPISHDDFVDVMENFVEKKLFKVIIDPRSPFSFTTEGVLEAFKACRDQNAHGKLVIELVQQK